VLQERKDGVRTLALPLLLGLMATGSLALDQNISRAETDQSGPHMAEMDHKDHPQMPGMEMSDEDTSNGPGSLVELLEQHATSGADAEPNSTPFPMLMTRKDCFSKGQRDLDVPSWMASIRMTFSWKWQCRTTPGWVRTACCRSTQHRPAILHSGRSPILTEARHRKTPSHPWDTILRTQLTSRVTSSGITHRNFRLEASGFHGREPTDDVRRMTASGMYNRPLHNGN
jgi:hypothetical protein